MSNDYIKHTPDNWILIRVPDDEPYYMLLSGWSGGYTTGNSWRISAKIIGVDKQTDSYIVTTYTGSKYRCRFTGEMLRMNTAGIWSQLCKEQPGLKQIDMDKTWESFT